MNWRWILIALIIIGGVLVFFFQDEALELIGKKGESGFSIGKSSGDMEFTATFSVIRFRGEPVSVQPVVGREQVMYFKGAGKEELKEVMGIEEYFENEGFIKKYKRPAVPMSIPSRGEFTHKLEKGTILLE